LLEKLKRFLYMEEYLLQSIKYLLKMLLHLQEMLKRFLYRSEHKLQRFKF